MEGRNAKKGGKKGDDSLPPAHTHPSHAPEVLTLRDCSPAGMFSNTAADVK